MTDTLRLGIVGIGGYARSIADAVIQHGGDCDPPLRIVACSDPQADAARLAEAVDRLKSHGVAVFTDNAAVVEHEDVDAVWLPLPIQLHRPLTEWALSRGKAVMCEKPAAGTVQEVRAMMAARDAAGLPCLIGFQDVYEPLVVGLKRRLLAGEFGAVRSVVIEGRWPRTTTYFSRNQWAGRLSVPGLDGEPVWILDSPLNNAMSHFVHQGLFYLGTSMGRAMRVGKVEAELYKAASIESFDTVAVRVHAAGADRAPIVVLLTHACPKQSQPRITIRCEKARVVKHYFHYDVKWIDGRRENVQPDQPFRLGMLDHFAKTVAGRPTGDASGGLLEMAMEHTRLVNAVHMATPIVDLRGQSGVVESVPREEDEGVIASIASISGIDAAFEQASSEGVLLSELGDLGWTRPPGRLELGDDFQFEPASAS